MLIHPMSPDRGGEAHDCPRVRDPPAEPRPRPVPAVAGPRRASDEPTGGTTLPEPISRRSVLAGMAAMTAAAAVGSVAVAAPAYAATAAPLPLPPLRIPQTDMGVEQQPDATIQWLQDA